MHKTPFTFVNMYMKCTKIDPTVQSLLKKKLKQQPVIAKIVDEIVKNQGRALLVGGAVRDLLLDLPTKDLDIEIYDLTLSQLQKILQKYGPVSLVGKSFGVLRLHGLDIDWSLPRSDSAGRHPTVTIDPSMSFEQSFRRRDLTINSMGIDLKSFELIDPFNGLKDLQKKVLRAPDVTLFVEDPLRLFRVMQFIGRFAMQPDAALNKVCATMDIKQVSRERIESEFDKLMLKSERPSLGIRWLHKIKRLQEILPELYDTVGVPQEPEWHPEGDVFEHTMQAIDAGAVLEYDAEHEKLMAMFGVLCHDLGKVVATKKIDGRIRSIGHDVDGVPLAKKMLKRITRRQDLIDGVAHLVRYHMAPVLFIKNGAKIAAYKRLALKLWPVSIKLLALVSLADKRGRNAKSHRPLTQDIPDVDEFLKKAGQAHVVYKPEPPVVQGRDLLPDIKPGPGMGRLLKKAYDIQLDEDIQDKKTLLKRILS